MGKVKMDETDGRISAGEQSKAAFEVYRVRITD